MRTQRKYAIQLLIQLHQRALLALLLLLPATVLAGGVVLHCTDADLRTAMGGGGVVTFACDGTIPLTNTIFSGYNTTLDGSGHQITISGNSAARVFFVNGASFTAINLTIANGSSRGGSAILNLYGCVNLTGVSFRSNTASKYAPDDYLSQDAVGGAILNQGGTVSATNCSFIGNTAQSPTPLDGAGALVYGGAIRNESGQVDLQSCAFVGNQARGGSMLDPPANVGTGDAAKGGAIHNSDTVTLDLCTFSGNAATGGDASGFSAGNMGFSASEGSGGAIFNEGTLVVDRTTLCGNTATGGAGGHGGGGDRNGGSRGALNGYPGGLGGLANGAAICNLGSLSIARSTLVSNVVTGGSGGAGGAGVVGADFKYGGIGALGGDGRSGLGGALFNSGSASLVNCTIACNSGSGGAGGNGGSGAQGNLFYGDGGSGGNGGTGFAGVDGTSNLTNCTVAWNRGSGGAGGAGGAGNVAGAPGSTGAASGGTASGSLPNTLIASNTPAAYDSFPNPKLGPLADNGGPTFTIALLPGSPAIDAGNDAIAPATDQRGFLRPAGLATDLGAFEYGADMTSLAISRSGPTGLDILAKGIPDRSCRLLASPDLVTWLPMATNQFGADGKLLFHDDYAAGGPCRFYRLVMP